MWSMFFSIHSYITHGFCHHCLSVLIFVVTLCQVPKGHVWLQGDNAYNSTDSRHYGPVPYALIQGKVFYRVCSSLYLSIHLLSESVICRMNSRQLQRNAPCTPSLLFVVEFVICCTVPTAFWWSIRVLHFVVVGQADMATRRLGPCAESAALMDHLCIEILV
jgi:hypothetical protein